MHTLAAIKVTAPMLGFLGTLLGTINALSGIALTGAVDPRAMKAGISEALLMTVLGLSARSSKRPGLRSTLDLVPPIRSALGLRSEPLNTTSA